VWTRREAELNRMSNPLRRITAVALAVAAAGSFAATADAHSRARAGKRATTTTTTAATPAAAPVTSVIAIGGYVFYNLTYLEAVEAWQAAVAAAPAGYTPPPVTSVSVSTTVSGTVDGE
jgi:hypothetical protein